MTTASYVIDSIPIRIISDPAIKALYPGECTFTKDFCIVPPINSESNEWVGFGSGGTSETEQWLNLRITADNPYGPFTLQEPAVLLDKSGKEFIGPQLCAPSVCYDAEKQEYVMSIQEACFEIKRDIHIFTSKDGKTFYHQSSVFSPEAALPHSGAYDPEHSEIKIRNANGVVTGTTKICVYTGINRVSLGSIFLIKSTTNSWEGPWELKARIFGSEQAKRHHNQDSDPDREWCTEGEQIFELDEELVSPEIYERYGKKAIVLLNYVGFYPKHYSGQDLEAGTRQHNALAVAYHSDFQQLLTDDSDEERNRAIFADLGNLHKYSSFKETGHGTLRRLPDGKLGLFRQERDYNPVTKQSGPWRYALDILDPDVLYKRAVEILKEKMTPKEEKIEHYKKGEFVYW